MKHIERLLAIGGMVTSLSTVAAAQTAEERAGARAAAEQGVAAYAEGRWAQVIELMARAEKLVHAPTHLLYQAQAEEQLGHLVAALEIYRAITREKLAQDAPDAFVSAQQEAQRRAEALQPRLSHIRIVLQGQPVGADVEVTMDDRKVPDALVGLSHPVDPGAHRFAASSKGMRSSVNEATLSEGSAETVVLTLQGVPNTDVPATTANRSEAPATRSTPSSRWEPLRIGGFIGLGVGALGLGVGTIFAIRARGLRDDAADLYARCLESDNACYQSEREPIDQKDDDADTARTVATIGFAAGGIGIAAGVTMLLLAPSTPSPSAAHVVPYVTPGGAGVWGRF